MIQDHDTISSQCVLQLQSNQIVKKRVRHSNENFYQSTDYCDD